MGKRALLALAVAELLILTVTRVTTGATTPEDKCRIGTYLTVTTAHNASGHWLASLLLKRNSPLGQKHNTMKLDVVPTTMVNGNIRTDSLAVLVEGPLPENYANCTKSAPPLVSSSPAPIKAALPPPSDRAYKPLGHFGYYKVHPEGIPWLQAKAACEAEDAHLVILDSHGKAAAIQKLLASQPPGFDEWIHVGYFSPNTNFVTIFGAPLTSVGYQKWAPGEPNMGVCGHMDKSMLYYDGKCDWTHPFICEYHNGLRPALPELPKPTLPPAAYPERTARKLIFEPTVGYDFLMLKGRKHYYKVHAEEVSWWQAKSICEAEKAHLVVINAHAEADRLRDFLERRPEKLPKYLHVGVRAVEYFVTIFGTPLSSSGYERWESEQPDDERCVVINHDIMMFDGLCSFKTAFICEQAVA